MRLSAVWPATPRALSSPGPSGGTYAAHSSSMPIAGGSALRGRAAQVSPGKLSMWRSARTLHRNSFDNTHEFVDASSMCVDNRMRKHSVDIYRQECLDAWGSEWHAQPVRLSGLAPRAAAFRGCVLFTCAGSARILGPATLSRVRLGTAALAGSSATRWAPILGLCVALPGGARTFRFTPWARRRSR